MISQKKLHKVVALRAKIAALTEKLGVEETALFGELKDGAKVAAGALIARIKTWERRNVAWKDVVIREKGEEYADRVLAATKPQKYEKLEIETAA